VVKLDCNLPDCGKDDEIALGFMEGIGRTKIKKLKPELFDLLVPCP
jgi:hypothetical protein